MRVNDRHYYLGDDGTMDTVIDVYCVCGHYWEERLSCEAAASYRDPMSGELVDLRGLAEDYLANDPCPNCDVR